MRRFFAFLFSGCWHKWQTVDRIAYRNNFMGDSGVTYALRCERCGDLKFKTTLTKVDK